ncbi:MAG: acyl-ACP--UDP-N-acetylglucosamine O-acyltransferase [Deltaproteobacteria bacterium]
MSDIKISPVQLLPHRYPFLLIDRVVEIEPGKRIVAIKNITRNEPQFTGHFPERPIMPGVLLCEAMAQAGGLLVSATVNGSLELAAAAEELFLVLTTLDQVRFRRQVVPGDQVEIEVELVRKHRPLWKLKGRAMVEGQLAAQAEFSAVEVDPDEGPARKEIRTVPSADVHPTAVVARGAKLEEGVVVGPYSIIGEHVHLGRGTQVGPHATIEGNTTLGEDCVISPYASVGSVPQDKKFHGENSRLVVGARNRIREYATLSVGTEDGGMVTTVGDDNLFMNFSHVAHDCVIGNHCILANGAQLAGHVTVENHAIISGLAAIAQFSRIGESAFLGGGTMVVKDVPPFCLANGDRAKLTGLNVVGLERRGFSAEQVLELKQAYRSLFRSGALAKDAIAEIRRDLPDSARAGQLADFVAASERGVTRP